ncbi:MAG: prolyl oligopeptidase family serine peptidase [Saprospiraceae bacterium]|nr:prolyl oligopeptidase family serine peptidase [Saprospiraceae bacterium]MDP4819559.1 prolyl oligopeptidase family serine peptidase [Saprospiraceae bacterium]
MSTQKSIPTFVFSFLLYLGLAFGQTADKKMLDIPDFDVWQSISHTHIASQGEYIAWVEKTDLGDPTLKVYHTQTRQTLSFERGDQPAFSPDGQSIVFARKAPRALTRQLQRAKTAPDKMPGDSLVIVHLPSAAQQTYPDLKSMEVPQQWDNWVVAKVNGKDKAYGKNAFRLLVKPLNRDTAFFLDQVTHYSLAETTEVLFFAARQQEPSQQAGVYRFQGTTGAVQPVHLAKNACQQLSSSADGTQAAFLLEADTTKSEQLHLHHWQLQSNQTRLLPAHDPSFLPEQWLISANGRLRFSPNGQRLFFGIAPELPEQDPQLLDEEIVQVEVWHYNDARLYPQQKVELSADKRKSYTCLYDIPADKFLQLGSTELPDILTGKDGDAEVALAYTDLPYLRETSWEGGPAKKDVFLINLRTGAKTPVANKLRGNPMLSPDARYVYWFDVVASAWFAYHIQTQQLRQLTGEETSIFYDELNDSPDYPSSYGLAGWTDADAAVLIYDRYDIWQIDPSGATKPRNLTGARKDKQVMRYIRVSPEEKSIPKAGPWLLHLFDEASKAEGYVELQPQSGTKTLLQKGDYKLSRRPLKAKNADHWVFSLEDYQQFPDLRYSKNLRESTQISRANPQQEDYQWGSIELVSWTSLDGEVLQGLLVKPDNFDPNKKYPMIVNFYERSSDGLHNHRAPVPNRSQITYAFYASRGYLVFNPDIPYKIGYPGESAFNAVVSGVTHLLDRGFVDKDRVALQGHSWGGYQIAYILTRTNMFRCAESGAPVVNMLSAYGGIRWGPGVSRQFQYEHQQSRIGGTIWEYPVRFMENSPIFTLDKINTPVLIMHNDEDAAVPWEQGIEFFTALRRLDRKVWMLNYNGEPHWPVKRQNRVDFQYRMMQFFDYYLKDAPMPRWMESGVPAMEKGIRQGFEYTDRKN